MNETKKVIFMIDGTASMGRYLTSLKETMYQVILQLGIMENVQIGVMVYRDYDCQDVINWSGWNEELFEFVRRQEPRGGADYEEALKTSIQFMFGILDENCLVVHYTDAGPHVKDTTTTNYQKEKKIFEQKQWNFNWDNICKEVRRRNIDVVNVVNKSIRDHSAVLIKYGDNVNSDDGLTKTSMNVVNEYLGVGFYTYDRICMKGDLDFITDIRESKSSTQEIKKYVYKFKNDSSYRDKIFNLFEKSINKHVVRSLTYNNLLGTMWRQICARIRLPDERAIKLSNQMGNVINELEDPETKEIVQKWLEDSYDNTEEIEKIIQSVPSGKDVYVLSQDLGLTKRELMLILTGKAKLKDTSELIKVVSNIEITTIKPDDYGYIPVSLSPKDVFSLIPHLVAPGLMISNMPSCILAIYTILSKNVHLKDIAHQFLTEQKGKWLLFDENNTQNFTVTMVTLLSKVKEYLTSFECQTLDRLYTLLKIKRNLNAEIEVCTPWSPSKDYIPDHKVKCEECNHYVSTTIMHSKTICGLCDYSKNHPDETFRDEPRFFHKDKSSMRECRTCAALYEVIYHDQLNVPPKCHFCRMNTTKRTVCCNECNNTFIDDAGFYNNESFVCKVCTNEKILTKPIVNKVTIRELLPLLDEGTRIELTGIKFKLEVLDKYTSLYKIFMEHEGDECDKYKCLKYNNKPVVNRSQIEDSIKTQLDYEDPREMCLLCCENVEMNQMIESCGNCTQRICKTCFKEWYNNNPGEIVYYSKFNCPFCKQVPKYSVIKPINRLLAMISRKVVYDPKVYDAWCKDCNKIVYYCDKSCAREIPKLKGYQCKDCKINTMPDYDKNTKTCPNIDCGITVEKDGGCNHITCVCHNHWCWHCKFIGIPDNEGEDVYDHLSEVHGGFF